MANAADILIRILGDSSGFSKATKQSKDDVHSLTSEVNKAGQSVSAFGSIVQGVFQGIGQAVFRSIGTGIGAAVGEINKAIEASSNLAESINKTGVAFGDNAKDIVAWSQDSSTALGQSQGQALEAASSFGLLFRTMGLGSADSADMSKRLVELATDLASINNIPIDEALLKLRSGLVGEAEPLRTVGVLLNETAVQQEALLLGLAPTTAAISEQDKVMARYQLILNQTQLSQGDFARTSGELANAERILAAQQEDALTRLGDVLKPVKLAFVKGLSELITVVAPYGENIMNSLAQGLADGIVAILPVLQQVRALFTYWLKPGSPPKLLPQLTEWGKGAMKAYMEGWSDPDIGALKSLGGAIEGILRSSAGAGQLKETDLVARVFGSEKALVDAINEWRQYGNISITTLDAIRRSAGPAGDSVGDLVNAYFNLQDATKGATEAQRELDEVTRKYDTLLSPLQQKLGAIQDQEQQIRDDQRLKALGDIIKDPTQDLSERRLARLEQEEILAKRQIGAVEDERDAAVDAEQKKVDAAKKEQDAKQLVLNQAQAVVDQQNKTNELIGEEIDLRKRLADEALAAQTKAQNELEAAQRKADTEAKQRQADLDRIYDAHLRYSLAITDTAGQLAIMQGELAKTTTGSADYFDILTQIAGLEERLQKERDAAGANDPLGALGGIIPDASELTKAGTGITALSEALKKAFDALSGSDGKTVELAPAWQTFADMLGTIGQAAKEAGPFIQTLIDIVTGKEADGTAAGADPFGDNWWLKGIVPTFRTVTADLDTLQKGGWGALWTKLKGDVTSFAKGINPKADADSFGFYAWLVDTVIPAIDLLAARDWKDAFTILGAPINAMVDGAYQQGYDLVANWWKGVGDWFEQQGEQAGKWLAEKLHELNPNLFPLVPGPDPNKMPHGTDPLPPNTNSSYPGGGLPGIVPASLSALGGSTSTATTNNALGPINLIFNAPVTADMARSAAQTVDAELRRRGYAPT